VLFETAFGVKGLEGAATTQEAEAKAQIVAEVKRILRLMVQYEKAWESTSYLYYLCIFPQPSANGACTICVRPSRLCKS
jgi:hypothetical protein